MKKAFIVLIFIQVSLFQYGQIIADHTVVDKYDEIPQYYIDLIKKMWLATPGESHGYAYRTGLTLLEALDSRFQISISGTPPEGYSESYLRSNGTTWGDLTNPTGWIHYYGEEDWFTSSDAIDRTKAGITYCNTHNYNIAAFGFAWCYDPAILSASAYLAATQEYINHCVSNGYSTKVFFTTGPVDEDNARGELGYKKYLLHEEIRNYVKADPSRILFDFADILCYDDNGNRTTTTWDGNTYPIITPTNLGDASVWHMSNAGALRLGKAQWWMLARMAGWDGGVTRIEDSSVDESDIWTEIIGDELKVHLTKDLFLGKSHLYAIDGSLKASIQNKSDLISFDTSNLSSGMYILIIQHNKSTRSKKVILP